MDQGFVKAPYPPGPSAMPNYGVPAAQGGAAGATAAGAFMPGVSLPAGYAPQQLPQPPYGGAPAGYGNQQLPPSYGAVAPSGAAPLPGGPISSSERSAMPGQPPGAAAAAAEEGSSSAPPFEMSDAISGYEGAGITPTVLAPPSYEEVTSGQPRHAAVSSVPAITEEDARSALLSHVADHCCYGAAAARELVFRDLRSSSAFHYTLETFTETRSCLWDHEPYTGQVIDGPQNGRAPSPWEIVVNAPPLFTDGELVVEVPHTASIKGCTRCHQSGRVRCTSCMGFGTTVCLACGGSGHISTHYHDSHDHHHHHHHRVTCSACCGSGRARCCTCFGTGSVTCRTCKGFCRLKCYLALTVTWKVHLKDHIVERTALPDNLIRGATGGVAFEEQMPRVWPINHFPDESINSASRAIVEQHAHAFPLARVLMQRQRVRVVPVTEAFSTWRNKDVGVFYVYGLENKVYAPEYPQKCCWGCNIL